MHQLLRFAGVGLVATLIHVTLALIAQMVIGLPAQICNLIGFSGAVLFSYFGHSRFTFDVDPDHSVHLPRFLTVSVIGLIVSTAITQVVSVHLGAPFYLAMALVAVSVPPVTYFAVKFWAFSGANEDGGRVWLGVGLAILAATVFLVIFYGRSINHDTAWYLVATRKWLAGARLYVDIVEVNPPLNFYLTVPVIWLADATGLSDTNAQYGVVAGLMAISLLWTWELLGREAPMSIGNRVFLISGIAAGLIFVPMENVGQREHLMLVFVLPWLMSTLTRDAADVGGGTIARAAFASIGICLKPHFLQYPVAITIYQMIRSRSFRPILSVSNITMVCIGACYVAAVMVLHPTYLTAIVPLAAQVYGAYGFGPVRILLNLQPEVIAAFAVVMVVVWRGSDPVPGLSLLGAAILAAIGCYFAQGTGYGYQSLPAHVLIFVACVWILAVMPWRTAVGVVTALCLVISITAAVNRGFYKAISVELFNNVVQAAGPNPRLLILSTGLLASFPLVLETNAQWISRYPALWPIPGPINALAQLECEATPGKCDAMRAILDETRENIVSDLVKGQPDILIIQENPMYIDDDAFDFRVFLGADPRFDLALRQFVHVEDIHGFEILRRQVGP